MRLLQIRENSQFIFVDFVGDDRIPSYAILSHTWSQNNDDEVTFKDMIDGLGKKKPGYKKIQFCGEQAIADGLQYFWVDTCCINKQDEAEVSRSINSMFRWYRNAARCYVYLADVLIDDNSNDIEWYKKLSNGISHLLGQHSYATRPVQIIDACKPRPWKEDFQKCKWFSRGWTLQELLAPDVVEFFSREGKLLGDKSSLKQQISRATNIPESALDGRLLSQFSVEKRFDWIKHRETKVEEDKVYSLLGIFDVEMDLFYGEGAANARSRLQDIIDKRERCMQDLHVTDPRDDKKRIVDANGGLLEDSYSWILQNSDFQQWRREQQSRLLWIKGDPGKGKTMLLCGITDELKNSMAKSHLLSYFFCQATDSRINSATAVLRGLIYLLVDQQSSLVSHVRKKYDNTGKVLFEDANAWIALTEIFYSILQDPTLSSCNLIVDALDECKATDLPKLLNFIVKMSATCPRGKWIVSSRNWPSIEKGFGAATQKARLCLELNEASISKAVATYTQFKVDQLAKQNRYSNGTRDAVQRYLSKNAKGTFLWVALVCQELADVPDFEAEELSQTYPPGLDPLYARMLDQIFLSKRQAQLCKSILAVASTVYKPITFDELTSLVDLPASISGRHEALTEIIGRCGSFLTVRKRVVFLVHQSAKDFLVGKARNEIFPSGTELIHHSIFSQSLQAMSKTLRRDLYSLSAPGSLIDKVQQPDMNPLSAARYSCVYWINHLLDCDPAKNAANDIQDSGAVDTFLRKTYLYWLEALSLCRSMSEGVISIAKLETLLQDKAQASQLLKLVKDAYRFIMYHKVAIENSPLQAYAAALLFSPTRSRVRELFKHEEPQGISIPSGVPEKWSACLSTLEGHSDFVSSVAFSSDSNRLASGSMDYTVKIWDAHSGACLSTLKGHSSYVKSVAFSGDSSRLASASMDRTVRIWDAYSGACLSTLEGHSDSVSSVAFSSDSSRLASASYDRTVKIWDVYSSACLLTLEGHSSYVESVAFSSDSSRLASASCDSTVKIWNAYSGACLSTLEGHGGSVYSVAFSSDSKQLASASYDRTVKTWDAHSGACLSTLEGHSDFVSSVAFSSDSKRLASGSMDRTVKIWDAHSGACLSTLGDHGIYVCSVAFSSDSKQLASASYDCTVKIWDTYSSACLSTLEGHSDPVSSVAFSSDSSRLASASYDRTVKIWDVYSSACLLTLKGHSTYVKSVAFSSDSSRLASASMDRTVKIWDAYSGACLSTLEGHSDSVSSVAFSSDSNRLASASEDRTVKIWDAYSGACLSTLEGHSGYVQSVAFSSDSNRLASGSSDRTVKIWDAQSGACLSMLEIGKTLSRISFDIAGTHLYTEIGTIDIATSSVVSPTSNETEYQSPQYQGGGLRADETWITYNSENVLWLPSEYRPLCSAVSANTVGIGVGSGKVWICSFASLT